MQLTEPNLDEITLLEPTSEEIALNAPEPPEEPDPTPSAPQKIDRRKKLRRQADKSDPRPSLRLPAADAEVSPLFAAMGALLKDRDFFRRGLAIAVVQKLDGLSMRFPNAVALGEIVEKSLRLVKLSKKTEVEEGVKEEDGKIVPAGKTTTTTMEEVKVTLPDRLAKKALESEALKASLREIRSVEQVRLPILRDGKLEKLPVGFADGVYSADSVEYRTDMPLEEATAFLDELFGEFRFKDSRSKSVILALAVSEYVKYLYPTGTLRPAVLSQSNAPVSGKTLLIQMALSAVHGYHAATPYPNKPEEVKKTVEAIFDAGNRIVFFDNVSGYFNHDAIAGLITSPLWTGRILQQTKMVTWRHEAQVCASGNNLKIGPDLLSRALIADLRQTEENPLLRRVKNPFSEERCKCIRPQFLAALWTLTKNWVDKERPEGIVWGRFEAWCKTVGGIITAAGYADPCEVITGAEVDVDGNDARALISAMGTTGLAEKGPSRCVKTAVTPSEIRAFIENEELFSARMAGCKSPNAAGSTVGLILREWTDRDCAGYRLRNDGKPGKRRKYWVEPIEVK